MNITAYRSRRAWKPVLLLIITTMALSACTPKAPPSHSLTPITVQLRWTHQAQNAGLYAADQKGYYAAEGLAVTFLTGGAQVNLTDSVLDNKAQFGVTGADSLIVERTDGKPVQAIATIYRCNPVVFIALANSGITRPQDFIGKTIHIHVNAVPTLYAMMAHIGISRERYNEVFFGTDLAPLIEGRVHVWTGFITNQPLTLEKAGYKYNLIYPDNYGVHFYSDTIFTTDDFIAKSPELVRRFLRATLKGWHYAVENPNTSGQMVARYNPTAEVEHENEFMTTSLPLINTGQDYIGWMKSEMWAGMEKTLREQSVITKPLDVTQVYTMKFLQEIYGK